MQITHINFKIPNTLLFISVLIINKLTFDLVKRPILPTKKCSTHFNIKAYQNNMPLYLNR